MKIFETFLFLAFAALVFPSNAAAQNCGKGYWYDPAFGCAHCYAGCKECINGNPGGCTVCLDGSTPLRSPSDSNNWNCAQISCSSGQYRDGDYCRSCMSQCATCTNGTTCSSCRSGQYLKNGSCYSCPQNCSSCSGTSSCTSCKAGYVLKGGQCEKEAPSKTVSSCPSHMTLSSDGNCCIIK